MRCTTRYEYLRAGELLGEAAYQGILWSIPEVTWRFPRAGLRVRSIWGSYGRTKWEPRSSRRFIIEVVRTRDDGS